MVAQNCNTLNATEYVHFKMNNFKYESFMSIKKKSFSGFSGHSEQSPKSTQRPHFPRWYGLHFLTASALFSFHVSFNTICQTFLILGYLKIHEFFISSVWIAYSLDINITHFLLPFSYADIIWYFSFIFFLSYLVYIEEEEVTWIMSKCW